MALSADQKVLRAIRKLIARKTPSSSSVRGSLRGTTKAAQDVLSSLPLTRFTTRDEREFQRRLETSTRRLEASLPGRNSWGLARKLLNMFLRDCCYNAYLRSAYGLGACERFLEVPLDSLTIKQIGKQGRGRLRPVTLSTLDRNVSDEYQYVAAEWAKQLGIRRVHLDAFIYGERSDDD